MESKKSTLSVTLVEFDIEWESPTKNFEYLNSILVGLKTDLIVLPEMFSTGFSMNTDLIAEEPFGKSYQWMKELSNHLNCAVCGSIPTKENGKFYNRFYFVFGDSYHLYNKKHLFGYGRESEFYSSGNEIVEFAYLGWVIRPIVCYDLRFPVWCRNNTDYDLLLCVANWPKPRIDAWVSLLKARAIENMSYSIGLNRIGTDPNGIEYIGKSKVFNSLGEEIKTVDSVLKQVVIDKTESLKARKRFGFLEDRDRFNIH